MDHPPQRHAKHLGDDKGHQTEDGRFPFYAHELVKIHFQTSAEHKVDQPDGGKKFHTVVCRQYVEPVRPNQHAADDHPYDPG